jgi:hypothetical protein
MVQCGNWTAEEPGSVTGIFEKLVNGPCVSVRVRWRQRGFSTCDALRYYVID